MSGKTKDTLCCYCKWAAGKDHKCPWAHEFKPVPGWEAEPTKIEINNNGKKYNIDSFIVKKCPLFELMTKRKKPILSDRKDKEAL